MASPRNLSPTGPDRPSRAGQLGALLGHVRWLLGNRFRWVVALPFLNVGAATAEVVLLVAIVQSLLLFVGDGSTMDIALGPVRESLSRAGLLWLGVAASVTSISLRAADSVLVGRLAARAAASSRERLISSYFATDWQAMTRVRAGRLQQLLGLNAHTAATSIPQLATLLAGIVNLAVYGVFVVVASPIVGVTFVVLGLVMGAAFTTMRRRIGAAGRASQEQVRDVQLAATTLASLNRELQLFNVQHAARRMLQRLNDESRRTLARLRTLQRFMPNLFQQTMLLAIILLVALAGQLSVEASSFGTAAILALRSLNYLQHMNTASQTLVEAAPYLAEMRAAVDHHREQARVRGTAALGAVEELELRGVHFAYDDEPILRDVSVRLERGDWLAVVGPSGGGKSTLVNVLAGLLTPDRGTYLVNGRDAGSYSAESWARNFALLSQEPTLMRDSVAENISFYRRGELSAVEAAAERAAVAADIRGLPDAWDTLVGDGEANLSGGQRQRVALARALFGDPSVLILDEPTSALDAANERLIEQSLRELGPDVIVVVVSHRPALLELCNRFLVIEDGRVTASGSRDEVPVEDHVGRMSGQDGTVVTSAHRQPSGEEIRSPG